MNAHIHACIHTYIYTHAHKHTQTYIHIHTHAYIRTCDSYTYAYIHIFIVPRPEHWVEVKDKNNSGMSYYWNPKTNETTPLGSPDPSVDLSAANRAPFGMQHQQPQPQTLGQSMVTYMTLGFGMSMAFAMVGMIFR